MSHRATECLGSGQFGTVNKGVWQSPTSTMEVAIKTLKSTAKEEDRVKFLQEGAIMGQFRHPNVVKLHGIVREQQTVSLTPSIESSTHLPPSHDVMHQHIYQQQNRGTSTSLSIPHYYVTCITTPLASPIQCNTIL